MGPDILTRRLLLRPWTPEDAEAALRIYADSEVTRFIGMEPIADLESARNWLAKVCEFDRRPDRFQMGAWALQRLDDGAVIGTGLLKPLPPGRGEIEVGWHLAREAWGQGLASETGLALLRHGFHRVGLDEIFAVIEPDNIPSLAVARRIGMRCLGRSRDYYEGLELELFRLRRNEFESGT